MSDEKLSDKEKIEQILNKAAYEGFGYYVTGYGAAGHAKKLLGLDRPLVGAFQEAKEAMDNAQAVLFEEAEKVGFTEDDLYDLGLI